MIMTGEMIVDTMEFYEQPRLKLARDAKKGKYIRLKRNLYCDDPNMSPMSLAQSIYGPSYISFDFALSLYGLIPEAAKNITCATYKKRRDKAFDTDFCTYYYTDVPARVFNLGVAYENVDGYNISIACREKALCDKLYKLPTCSSKSEFEALLFDDLRVFDDALDDLDRQTLAELSQSYRNRNVAMLDRLVRGDA
jgi:predicted transcriptional regulator of viral defense system